MLRTPRAFAGGARPFGGGEWVVAGKRWRLNPRVTLPRGFFHVVALWQRTRSGMGGTAALPEAGGLNQQPAWLLAAFDILEGAEAELRRDAAAQSAGAEH